MCRSPTAGPGEVLIEVKACGICGTDVHVLHDEFPYWPPVILGHEFSGEIVELGPGVHLFHSRRPRGGRTAHEGLRALLPVPHGQHPDLQDEALARLGHRRRLHPVPEDAGTAAASHSRTT